MPSQAVEATLLGWLCEPQGGVVCVAGRGRGREPQAGGVARKLTSYHVWQKHGRVERDVHDPVAEAGELLERGRHHMVITLTRHRLTVRLGRVV
jgi:hypothetical protein